MNLFDHVVYRCIVGSRAYGLDEPGSDTDRRGIYVAPPELDWSLEGAPEQIERDETQECYWELRKFLRLALRGNPNILECLYTPLVEHASPLARELIEMRSAFLSKRVYETYCGYAVSQLRKLERDQRTRGAIRWKHAMHLVRLLLAGIGVLRDGVVPVSVDPRYRDRLLAIRRGEEPWADIDAWRSELVRDLDRAYATTPLPEEPDVLTVNAFLVRARRSEVV